MIATILAMVIIGLVGVLVGMIIESAFENANYKKEPEQETIQVIEINDHRKETDMKANDKHINYFDPF